MLNLNDTKRFECSNCGKEQTRTLKQVTENGLGSCEKCGTKLSMADFEGLRNRANKDLKAIDCYKCDGTGVLSEDSGFVDAGEAPEVLPKCNVCNGTGKLGGGIRF